jgi:hypothetical protein
MNRGSAPGARCGKVSAEEARRGDGFRNGLLGVWQRLATGRALLHTVRRAASARLRELRRRVARGRALLPELRRNC